MNSHDMAKRIATAQARAALLGLMLQPLDDGAWLRSCPRVAPSLQAAEAVLYALEAARAANGQPMPGAAT